MKREISAGAVIFRRESEDGVKFLLLYHGRGYWNFPKGRLESGEKAVDAFIREVAEETGLKKDELRIVPGFKTTARYFFNLPKARTGGAKGPGGRGVFKIVIFYLVETRKRRVVISDEHEGFGWFSPAEASRLAKYKNTQDIIKNAHEFIRKNLRRGKTHPKRQGGHLR